MWDLIISATWSPYNIHRVNVCSVDNGITPEKYDVQVRRGAAPSVFGGNETREFPTRRDARTQMDAMRNEKQTRVRVPHNNVINPIDGFAVCGRNTRYYIVSRPQGYATGAGVI